MGNFCSRRKKIQRQYEENLLVAKFSYTKFMRKSDEVLVKKVINKDWYNVENLRTYEQDNIPSNFVAKPGSIELQDWYYEDVTRMEVESYLLSASQPGGTFLVRKSESVGDVKYILSVRFNRDKKAPCLKHVDHFPIIKNKRKRYFLNHQLDFATVKELIETYISKKLNLFNSTIIDKRLYCCVTLKQPCNRKKKGQLFNLSPIHAFNWELSKREFYSKQYQETDIYGLLFRAKYKSGGTVKIRILREDLDSSLYLREVAVLKLFRHKNIVTMYGICSMCRPIYIIQEYILYGDLINYLKKHNLTERKKIYFAYQVASGMQYIESRNVVHGDLAARNILIDINLVVKISDIGLARSLRKCNNNKLQCLESTKVFVKWLAPETYFSCDYTIKSDVWSYGVFLIELYLSGGSPYNDMNTSEVIKFVTDGNRLSKPPKMSLNIYDFTRKCWNVEPKLRPTFHQIKQFFNRYNE